MSDGASHVLEVNDLNTVFHMRTGEVHAVNHVSFNLKKGELLGVVGESGSGKSVTMMSLIGLLPMPPAEVRAGEVLFDGQDLLQIDPDELRKLRGRRIGFVFQDPMTSLNPVFTVGFQIMEPLRRHMGMNKAQARTRAKELLELVGIPDAARRLKDYPHQFSQAQILELVTELREKLGMAIIWITHDLGVIAGIADRVIVMYGGQIVEHAPVRELFKHPRHPYTKALLETVPSVTGERADRLKVIEGQPPILGASPSACPFRKRCSYRIDWCDHENPLRRPVGEGHDVACFRDIDEEDAPHG
ncbi:MAG: ABC transporter ATP-binding protein [Maritimibacter sp.]